MLICPAIRTLLWQTLEHANNRRPDDKTDLDGVTLLLEAKVDTGV